MLPCRLPLFRGHVRCVQTVVHKHHVTVLVFCKCKHSCKISQITRTFRDCRLDILISLICTSSKRFCCSGAPPSLLTNWQAVCYWLYEMRTAVLEWPALAQSWSRAGWSSQESLEEWHRVRGQAAGRKYESILFLKEAKWNKRKIKKEKGRESKE